MLGYYCLVSTHFLLKDYASALKYLDVIKVFLLHACTLSCLAVSFSYMLVLERLRLLYKLVEKRDMIIDFTT